jgi:hypothetical protein
MARNRFAGTRNATRREIGRLLSTGPKTRKQLREGLGRRDGTFVSVLEGMKRDGAVHADGEVAELGTTYLLDDDLISELEAAFEDGVPLPGEVRPHMALVVVRGGEHDLVLAAVAEEGMAGALQWWASADGEGQFLLAFDRDADYLLFDRLRSRLRSLDAEMQKFVVDVPQPVERLSRSARSAAQAAEA